MKKLKTLLCALLAAGGITVAAQNADPTAVTVYLDVTGASNLTHYKATAYNAEEARTATFTVKTDNTAAFKLYRASDYTEISCENNETPVRFNPDLEADYMIEVNYGYSIYKVTLNGENIEELYTSRYRVSVKNGDVLNITSAFPDEEATITFSYNSGGKGCISNVRVNGEPVSDFNGETLKVKLGNTLSFEKANNWNISSWTVNDKSDTNFYNYSGTVRGDMAFSFIAQYDDPSVTLNVNVDNASAVKYSYYSYASSTTISEILKAGDNQIKVDRYTYINFEPVSPYAIKEITNLDTGSPVELYGTSWSVTVNGNQNYKITTYNEEEARTATATFNIDNVEKVNVRRYRDSHFFELHNGENVIKFNPETETLFIITSKSDVPLWEVKFNGEAVTAENGSYNLTLEDGCTVDVTATIPDIDIKATFEITDEDAAANLITGVKVDGQDVEFNGTSVDLKAGQKIELTFDRLYNIDNFTVGQKTEYVYSTSYTSPVLMEDTKFTIVAHRLKTFKVKVIVDDPENVTVGNGYNIYSNPTILDLRAGENEVELPENNTSICWQANDGCELVSVKYNNTEINLESNYSQSYEMEENSVIEFTTAKIAYDKKAVVWVDDINAAANNFTLEGNYEGDRKSIAATTGYTEFSFRDAMLPMSLSWYGQNATVGKVYVNNELVAPQYEGTNTYSLPLKDGDVIKVFLANEPVESKLKFDVEEGIEVTATTDRIVAVQDLAAEQTVFNGTEVALTLADNTDIIVKNGETELEPGEDGRYVVTVNGDTNLSVKKKGNLTITATNLTLVAGETAELVAEIKCDDDVTVKRKEYTSSNEAVATVDDNGTVTAVALGKATITITVTDNYGREFSASCEVTVNEKSGIVTVESGQLTADSEVYDLQGRRVNKVARGLYIINGKKVMVK